MKQSLFVILSIFISLAIVQASPKESYKTARRYIKECKSQDITPPLGVIMGWDEVEEYWASAPKLEKLREKFEEADKAVEEILMMDDEYRLAKSEEEKCPVYKRLQMESHEFRRAKKKRDEALLESNIRTFEYILKDYEKQGKEFPVDWIENES